MSPTIYTDIAHTRKVTQTSQANDFTSETPFQVAQREWIMAFLGQVKCQEDCAAFGGLFKKYTLVRPNRCSSKYRFKLLN